MKNVQSDAQGQLLLTNAMPIIPEDEEKMVKEASSIADMIKSPEMKFFRKFPKKIPEEVIAIEDSDEDPIGIKFLLYLQKYSRSYIEIFTENINISFKHMRQCLVAASKIAIFVSQ